MLPNELLYAYHVEDKILYQLNMSTSIKYEYNIKHVIVGY